MLEPPADLSEIDLLSALRSGWGVTSDEIAYLPVGAGSLHWSVAQRWFVKVDDLGFDPADRPAELDRIRRSLLTALSLHRDSGLDFVLAPLPDQTGEAFRRLSSRYVVTLYPLLTAESGRFAPHYPADRLAVVDLLARLHSVPPAIAPRIDLGVPTRDRLEVALSELGRPWTDGPYAAEARTLLASRQADVRRWLAECDRLAADQPTEWVLTHGEPHPGNFLRTGKGLILIDWNTVAIAPAERDLWMLTRRFAELVGSAPDGDDALVVSRYEQLTGRTITMSALDLWPIRWTLHDIAIYVDELRRGEDPPESLTYLRGYLRPSATGR